MENNFDVVIIGAGVSGCALFWTLSEYTDIKSVAVVDKCPDIAMVSSNVRANSQTIHDGSIETNYTAQKAKKVKLAAQKVTNYALKHNLQNKVIFKTQKMAIGVGDAECEFMHKRHQEFLSVFPDLEWFDKQMIKEIEPSVILGSDGKSDRPENVVGSGYREAWCAMDFEGLSKDFATRAQEKNPNNKVFLNFWVKDIKRNDEGYYLISKSGEVITAKFVLVNAGSYSLVLAQSMGYGTDLGCLPIAGSFYFVPDLLKGKVYMVQNPKLPFAAVHGDPDISISGKTRIGPTAIAMPKLERSKHWYSGISFELGKVDFHREVFGVLFNLLKDAEIRSYVFKNIVFELPYFGKRLFLKDAQKLIPSLKLDDIEYAEGYGEVRPQVVDRTQKQLELGEKKIITNKGITFNMTPSPGATSCLQNAFVDTQEIVSYLQANFDKERFLRDLSPEELDS
ncbi:FAD-dependent oxidoreductase [Helicobacter zhangjianzhongii]|uniref:FAD-dependent oxidoreductase n=1 Tax=Helicobacter zhangjianzhongii TaxID=2974574 RepID=A0ACC6FU15_9HELI|nr:MULTISPECIES: FAD-dependent oxidoreductase [unclassified Helicobacter]MDL0080571.1 FAD-dependent oxidoreductase [Helicobacter sp. CPD2-1]MDL0082788.1 FAD-dependent oxidoreductase [Helicobacter sp. XJK30-2]